jgi:hypothetical protein
MHPRTLLADDVKSAAEVKLFDVLRDGLGDDWDVFHSVSWVRRDKVEGALDGEIDFVLAHPEQGIVVLEVKGGDIDCRYGEWSRKVDGVSERMQDPFQQALDHRYGLQRLVGRRDWLVVQCVALPDVPVPKLQLAPDAPRALVLDRHDVEDIDATLRRVLAYHRGSDDDRTGPGRAGVERLRELFAPTIELRVPMAAAFGAEEQQLVTLSEDQARTLRALQRNRRMAVYGCAGSGKTMLAVEHAKRLADAGNDVLFVCFNKALGAHLHRTERHERITFQNFHGLCVKLIHKAGIPLDWPDETDAAATRAFWRDAVPDAYVEAVDALGPRWDALIVDEAQDLHDHWLTALRYGLRDDAVAPIWLFLDDNQRIYDGMLDVPDGFVEYELSTNCRTTQAIHRELIKLYAGAVTPDARGPEGRTPEICHTADQAAAVATVLDRLLGDDDVAAEQVVVLSAHGEERSMVRDRLRPRFVNDRTKARGRNVLFSSIRAFKGLESPVVVLCELEDLDPATRDAQLYVGMSRARNHCVIVAPPRAG